MIFLAFPYRRPLPKGQWAVAYVCTTNYHKLILMQATAERAMSGGFRRNSDSELKLKNRCAGSTFTPGISEKLHKIEKILNRLSFCPGVVLPHPPGRTPPWVDTPGQTPLWQTPPCPVHAGIR